MHQPSIGHVGAVETQRMQARHPLEIHQPKELISLAIVLLLLWYFKPYWPERLSALFDSLTGD